MNCMPFWWLLRDIGSRRNRLSIQRLLRANNIILVRRKNTEKITQLKLYKTLIKSKSHKSRTLLDVEDRLKYLIPSLIIVSYCWIFFQMKANAFISLVIDYAQYLDIILIIELTFFFHARYITALVTELGMLPCTSVPVVLRRQEDLASDAAVWNSSWNKLYFFL